VDMVLLIKTRSRTSLSANVNLTSRRKLAVQRGILLSKDLSPPELPSASSGALAPLSHAGGTLYFHGGRETDNSLALMRRYFHDVGINQRPRLYSPGLLSSSRFS